MGKVEAKEDGTVLKDQILSVTFQCDIRKLNVVLAA